MRFYSRKKKREDRAKQGQAKEGLSGADLRELRALKDRNKGRERQLMDEADEEELEEMEEEMEDLEPLTPRQRAGLKQELAELATSREKTAEDAARIKELDSVLRLDEARKKLEMKTQQELDGVGQVRTSSRKAAQTDFTGFGDSPFPLTAEEKAASEGRLQRYEAPRSFEPREKKRPNREPFNPLPKFYEDDDDFDKPSEAAMDQAVWEEVDDEDQKLVRAYMGLQRLRRNEQKLDRILQMAKPSKRDLLLLLTEVDALEGKDRRFMEKYVGPALDWEQVEEDLEKVYDWNQRDEEELPEFIGDSETVRALRKFRGLTTETGAEEFDEEDDDFVSADSRGDEDNTEDREREEAGERENEDASEAQRSAAEDEAEPGDFADKGVVAPPKINAAGVYTMEEFEGAEALERHEDGILKRLAARSEDDEILTEEARSEVQLFEKWDRLNQRKLAAEAKEPVEPRASLIADERHISDVNKLMALNPAAYEIDEDDDEFHEPSGEETRQMEVDLIVESDTKHREKLRVARERSEAAKTNEVKSAEDKELEALADDEDVQAVLGKDGLSLLLKKELTAEDAQRMRASLAEDEKRLDALQSLSSVWRMKQEVVAEWRAVLAASGDKLDERVVHEFMAEDDDSVESAWREDDDVVQQLDAIEQREFNRAIQAVRKQKRWIADQVQRVGADKVKQAVRDGLLRLKTHTALQAEMLDVLQDRLERGQSEAEELELVMEAEMNNMDGMLSDAFGVRAEDVASLRAGRKVDESKVFLSAEEIKKRKAEARPAVTKHLEKLMSSNIRSWIERDLLAEADGAQAIGDEVAAKKLRLMHSRRLQWSDPSGSAQSSLSARQLRDKGKILANERESAQSVQQALYGRMTTEEAEVNRQLVARGDGQNPRFMDEPIRDESRLSSVNPSLLPRQVRTALGMVDDVSGRERRDPNQLAVEWEAKSDEEKATISDAVEAEDEAENDEFDHLFLSQVPLKLHYKAVQEWHKLSEADKRSMIEKGRANRDELRHWIWDKVSQYAEEGEAMDPLSQYWIDEPDGKMFGAVEGAFWHVGRWGLDERTDEQRKDSAAKRIVRRHAPAIADTQTLLDEAETALFGLEEEGEEDDDDTRDVDIDVKQGDEVNEERTSGETDQDNNFDRLTELFQQAPEEADIDTPLELPKNEEERAAYELRDDSEKFVEYFEEPAADDEDDAGVDLAHWADDAEQTGEEQEVENIDDADMEEDPDIVERDSRNQLDHEEFNPRTLAAKEASDVRRRRFEDLDPVPTGDQRAFDDQYFHYDEEEYALMGRLDPGGVHQNLYQPPQSLDIVYNEYTRGYEKGEHVLSQETRQAIVLLHQSNPSLWTPAAIAMKFRMSHMHVKGILMVEAADERMQDHGLEDDKGLWADEDDDDNTDAEEYSDLTREVKLSESLTRRGDDGEMIDILEEEGEDEHITEDMLHMLPRMEHPRVPDVRFVNENDMAAVLQEEREIEERFLTKQARLAKRESEHFARHGPIGAATAPKYTRKADNNDNYQQPAVLRDGRLLPPIPHHLVMVDISERRQDRYSMAVRDVTGWLRQPTPIEFVNARRRERSEKARFVYTEYRQEKNTPI